MNYAAGTQSQLVISTHVQLSVVSCYLTFVNPCNVIQLWK